MDASGHDVTQMLVDWGNGDERALERLMPIVYGDLRRRARQYLSHEPDGHTLQPTALVNEAYLRLVDQDRVRWQNRTHFLAVAAQMMRRILVDHARAHHRSKRGGGLAPMPLDDVDPAAPQRGVDLVALDEVLERLAGLDPRQAAIVEQRYFAGMTIEETAEQLGISPATVKRDWEMARVWLFRELRHPPSRP
jgi:RNA polymerase sigma-70 factor, ECF subfamily